MNLTLTKFWGHKTLTFSYTVYSIVKIIQFHKYKKYTKKSLTFVYLYLKLPILAKVFKYIKFVYFGMQKKRGFFYS